MDRQGLDAQLRTCRSRLALQPDNPQALADLGLVLLRLGRAEEACGPLRRASHLVPGNVPLLRALAEGEAQHGNIEGAVEAIVRARRLAPADPTLVAAEAQLLGRAGRHDDAVARYRQLAAAYPSEPAAQSNLGNALTRAGAFDEALDSLRRAIALAPGSAVYRYNLGKTLEETGDWEGAEAAYRDAVDLDPGLAEAGWSLAQILWLRGDMRGAWAHYEARHGRRGIAPRPEITALPAWRGERFDGKTLLLWSEQGHGDSIQFVRYADLAKRRGGRVVVECQPALKRLFQSLEAADAVVARGEALPPCDLQLSMMSAPVVFETDLGTIPQTVPYLGALPADAPVLDDDAFRVGLVWAGNPHNQPADRRRSFHASVYAPLLDVPGVAFYGQQVGEPARQLGEMPGGDRIVDLSPRLTDFAATAGVVDQLDLVITTCTAVPHLVGALGREAWLLLSAVPDFRWFLTGDASPWYPSLHLYRQPRRGDWGAVVERVKADLAGRVGRD